MSKRNLFICFDAFGTLFRPKRPVATQYGEVARSLGLSGFSDDDVSASFKTAFKNESKQNPNYGKANGMNAERWWTNIIQNTFHPLLPKDQPLPSELVPKLLYRFWSDEGYILYPDVQPLLRRLRDHYHDSNGQMVVGLVTNSDDRVTDVLSSFGMRVSPARYGQSSPPQNDDPKDNDIDFAVMSYDVGYEKPDSRIFQAAEEMLALTLRARGDDSELEDADAASWQKLYVGDEYDKDVKGAVKAGWNAVLIDRRHDAAKKHTALRFLDNEPPAAEFLEMFRYDNAVGFNSLATLADWLPTKESQL